MEILTFYKSVLVKSFIKGIYYKLCNYLGFRLGGQKIYKLFLVIQLGKHMLFNIHFLEHIISEIAVLWAFQEKVKFIFNMFYIITGRQRRVYEITLSWGTNGLNRVLYVLNLSDFKQSFLHFTRSLCDNESFSKLSTIFGGWVKITSDKLFGK